MISIAVTTVGVILVRLEEDGGASFRTPRIGSCWSPKVTRSPIFPFIEMRNESSTNTPS